MINTWRIYLTLLFVLFALFSAVVYFDFLKFNRTNVINWDYSPTSDTDVVLLEVPRTEPSEEANLPETEPSPGPPPTVGVETSKEAKLPEAEPSLDTPPTLEEVDRFLADFGEQLKKLPEGRLVLFAPKAMKVSDKREVEARVGYKVPIEVLEKRSSTKEKKAFGALRVSVQMAAILTGPAFIIEAVTPAEQSVAEGFPTIWKWNVAANESGSQELEATLYAIVPGADAGVRHRIDSYVQTITVDVRERTWGDTLASFRETVESISNSLNGINGIVIALFGAAVTALGWLRLFRTRRSRAKASRPATDL